jgi:methylase of polypeptide subunit release factors
VPLVSALRADLAAARYRVDHLDSLWGAAAEAALQRGNRVPASRALAASDDPSAVLARLFVLGETADAGALAAALPTLGVLGAVELGLVEREAERVRPLLDLRPYAFVDPHGAGEWWIASDLGELATGAPLRVDHVLGVGGASTTLASLQFPDDVDSVLDLGTGCGIQALHARRFARRVVATDISERALGFARLNAALNAVDGIEFRLGSLYEPVADERFDRIVSNPPFVITPRAPEVPAYEYRDGGLVGDALVASVVAGAAEYLVPGGTAQLLGNWEYRWNADGLERAGDWAADAGLDAWIIERDRLDPARYAETWIRDGGTRQGDPEYDSWYAAWLDDFAARGVEYVGFGYVTLRRPADAASAPLARFEQVETSGQNPAGLGEHIERALAAHDTIAALADAELADLFLTVPRDVTEERHSWPGDENPTIITLHQGGGFGRALQVDPALSGLVGACDGELTVGQISDAIAELFEVDAAELRADLLPRVRELVVTGFLDVDSAVIGQD